MPSRAQKLFVGMGHLLRRDDGVGVRAAAILDRLPLPDDVEVFDAGLAGWELASVLERRSLVVVIDAIDADATPGEVFRLSPERVQVATRAGLSLHEFHLLDALDETRLLGRAPGAVVIFGIQPADLSAGIGLSPAVELGLARALPLALHELGVPTTLLSARTTHDERAAWRRRESTWTRH